MQRSQRTFPRARQAVHRIDRRGCGRFTLGGGASGIKLRIGRKSSFSSSARPTLQRQPVSALVGSEPCRALHRRRCRLLQGTQSELRNPIIDLPFLNKENAKTECRSKHLNVRANDAQRGRGLSRSRSTSLTTADASRQQTTRFRGRQSSYSLLFSEYRNQKPFVFCCARDDRVDVVLWSVYFVRISFR